MRLSHRRLAATLSLVVTLPLISVSTAAEAGAEAAPEAGTPSWSLPPGPLPLGPGTLTETRVEQQLAPGVTLTTITRGYNDTAREYWTIGVNIPVGPVMPAPDPSAPQGAIGPLDKANAVAQQLRDAPAVAQEMASRGWQPRIEPVDYAEGYPGGLIGYTLRIGRYATKPAASDPLLVALAAAQFRAFTVYTGQDGRPENTGPWVVRVLSVDPKRFDGRIRATVGDWVSGRETTTDMARKAGALYAMNGGFFTISPADGTPGVPAGLSVVDGTVLTAATNGRYALVLGNDGEKTRIAPLWSRYTIRFGAATHLVDALNRVPGVVRNCGGTGGDAPTQRPVHDFTCTDPDELVVLTPEYGTTPAAGAGVEALVDHSGTVTAVRPRTGASVPAGYRLVQATGVDATWLASHAAVGSRMHLETTVTDDAGQRIEFGRTDSVVNGGPLLVSDGRIAVNPVADGLVHEDPALNLPASGLGAAFGYAWFIRDNPRSGLGVDSSGRLLFVQVDGRQDTYSQGLSIMAYAQVMRALGAVDAINLDGGGSSATVVNGQLVSSPSDLDPQGRPVERQNGDAIVLVPRG